MSVITVFNASFTGAAEVGRLVVDRTGYGLVTEEEIESRAAESAGVSVGKLVRAYTGSPGLSLSPALARRRIVSHLKLAVAEMLEADQILLAGRAALLVPSRITHVLRVCLVATAGLRERLAREAGMPEGKIRRRLREDDVAAVEWSQYVGGRSPWDRRRYDLRLPMQEITAAEAAEMIASHAGDRALAVTPASREATADFLVAARAQVRLTERGHDVDVECENGVVIALLNRSVLSLDRYAGKLEGELEGIDGVRGVEARAGPRYPAGTFFREEEFELPSRVLLVDDESEFVMASPSDSGCATSARRSPWAERRRSPSSRTRLRRWWSSTCGCPAWTGSRSCAV